MTKRGEHGDTVRVESITHAEAQERCAQQRNASQSLRCAKPSKEVIAPTCGVLTQGFLAAAAVGRHWGDGQRGWTRQGRGQVSFAREGLVIHRDARIFGEEEGQI